MDLVDNDDYKNKCILYRKQIQDLIKFKNVSKKELSDNLGISKKKLDWFLSGKNLHYVVWNYPIYSRQRIFGHAFTQPQLNSFWNFIHTVCFERSHRCNIDSEFVAINIAINFTRTDLNLFENIYWYLIRQLAICLLKDNPSHIDTERAATMIIYGKKHYHDHLNLFKKINETDEKNITDFKNSKSPRHSKIKHSNNSYKQGKTIISRFPPIKNHNALFLRFKSTDPIPLYLQGTRLFPGGLPITSNVNVKK